MVLLADTFQQNSRGYYNIQSDYSQSDTQAVKQLTFAISPNGLMLGPADWEAPDSLAS